MGKKETGFLRICFDVSARTALSLTLTYLDWVILALVGRSLFLTHTVWGFVTIHNSCFSRFFFSCVAWRQQQMEALLKRRECELAFLCTISWLFQATERRKRERRGRGFITAFNSLSTD
ncbi:hypothetical protein B0T20DRAFT_135408 [Sordaria brevicollis]|uniref:Uncharacterized protein n=1 Tax=Sordaria brevicollis TaxID=83679 RepID=A0AAE0PM45_SORBR|nr:hypothetical protein B0T20DRAFT_135408 [Sordaria brevicollis]